MASGTRGAKRYGMTPQDVDDFIEECSNLLEGQRESEPRRNTPVPTPRDSRPEKDVTLHKGTSEIDELRYLLQLQRLETAELKEELAHRSPVTSDRK